APPLLVAYGSEEPEEIQRQSEDFLTAWRSKSLAADRLVIPGKNHYDVIDGFLDADSSLCSAVFGRVGLE
ncbi:MAG: hypothetical protein WKF44_09880, partial [Rubrobacteraceae bacterium]